MVKQSVKNYFGCLKYIFTPLGVIALGVVLGLSLLIPAVIDAVKGLFAEITEIGDIAINFDEFWKCFTDAVRALDWSNAENALATFFSKQWWIDTFGEQINGIIGEGEVYFAKISAAIDKCVHTLIVYTVVLLVFTVIAFVGGFFLTCRIIRRDIARRGLWKFIVAWLAHALLSAGYIIFTAWFYTVWHGGIYVFGALALPIAAFESLISAYLVHGVRKVEFSAVVNLKNAAKLLLSDLIIFAVTAAVIIFISLINVIVGIFIGLGILTVAVAVMNLNAESYVKRMAAEAENVPIDLTEATSGDIPATDGMDGTDGNAECVSSGQTDAANDGIPATDGADGDVEANAVDAA